VIDFSGSVPEPGNLDVSWHAGWPSAKHDQAPEIQSHSYDEHTVILRQNKSVHYEAPFLFLLFGNQRAVLLDTGATADAKFFPLRRVVDELIEAWLTRHPRERYGLVVAHTHGHSDHVAADGQFADRPETEIVGPRLAEVLAFYGFGNWPEDRAELDLGGRVLDVLPGPGHEPAATVFYDRYTGLLLTGDSLYPGRLYVHDWPAYVATVGRLAEFCETRPVTHVLGCHIEMAAEPGVDYPVGTTYQPDEPPLHMSAEQVYALRGALAAIGESPGIYRFPDFIVYHQG
jgi:glyoxylase-like metal-dependent hydrolase (beta-lactamase superfamily II)